MGNWKLTETKIRHRDSDPIRQKHLEEIANLEWEYVDTRDSYLLTLINAMYVQLDYYDEMEGYNL